jgi:predicted nucleic-acid-binding protein
MIAIDTNILVRFLVGDDTKQSEKVYKLFKDTEVNNNELYVPILVMLELIWVLDSVYEIKRSDLLDALSQITLMPILCFENLSALQSFILDAQHTNFDLSDLLIAHSAKQEICEKVLTFDKKASKHQFFELL